MCIIVAVPNEETIPEATLSTCWEANPHGAGYMFADGKEVIIRKGFMDFDSFMEDYNTLDKQPHVIHFRIATHGTTDGDNTHPFRVSSKLAFAHNGIINGVSNKQDKMSDTWHFNEELLKPLSAYDGKFYKREVNVRLLENFIGSSKLAFLNSGGDITLFNEKQGGWDNGVWYSNKSYKKTKQVPYEKPSTYNKWRDRGWWNHWNHKNSPCFEEGEYVVVNTGTFKGETGVVDEVGGASVKVIFHAWDSTQGCVLEKVRWMMPHVLTSVESWV